MVAALVGMMLSGGMAQAAGDGAAVAAQQAQVTADEAAHMGAWHDFWQKLLNPPHAVPDDYTTTVKTGGEIERRYLAHGPHGVAVQTMKAPKPMETYEIYYPSDMTESGETYPAVMMVNGSGTLAKRYPALFQHLASWGFIVIGNEDPATGRGTSAESTAEKLLALNQDPDSIFYHRIDVDRIGLSGHSQGGDGVFNAITSQPHHALYRTAVVLSPTNERTAAALRWTYDSTAVRTPILLLAGTKVDSISVADMKALYAKIPAPKVMAIRSGAEHGQMLYIADGYVTAWLCWQLRGDETAAKAFVGDSPELLQNGCYQDQKITGFD